MAALRERSTLVVSPHYDDAVMSAFALLVDGADVLNVFTGAPQPAMSTGWDRRAGFADSDASLAARQLEDDEALAPLGVARSDLGLLDGQYVSGRSGADGEALVDAVVSWVDAHPTGVVAVPAGAGGPLRWSHRLRSHVHHPRLGLRGGGPAHPDHLWVTDHLVGTLDGAAGRAVDLVLYEDLPYAWVRPADARVAEVSRRCGRPVDPSPRPVDVERKAAAIESYASQRDGNIAPWVRPLAAALPRTERYWLLAGA